MEKIGDEKMAIYEAAKDVPRTAIKPIQAGRLQGMSNINSQWRLRRLTELFGPVGFGWYIDNVRYTESVVEGSNPKDGSPFKETIIRCEIDLHVKKDGQWSAPIYGVGGSKVAGKGQGNEANDEAAKMSLTDAISVAAKQLGVAASIYEGLDDTKYGTDGQWVGNIDKNLYDQAVREAREAKTGKAVTAVWQKYPQFQNGFPEFYHAIAMNPNNGK